MASATAIRSISSSRTIGASCGLVRSGCGKTHARPMCVMSAMEQCRSSSSSRCRDFAAGVQLVEVLFGLGDQAVQARHGLARDLAVEELANCTCWRSIRALRLMSTCRATRSTSSHRWRPSLGRPRLQRLLVEELFDRRRSGKASVRSPEAYLAGPA